MTLIKELYIAEQYRAVENEDVGKALTKLDVLLEHIPESDLLNKRMALRYVQMSSGVGAFIVSRVYEFARTQGVIGLEPNSDGVARRVPRYSFPQDSLRLLTALSVVADKNPKGKYHEIGRSALPGLTVEALGSHQLSTLIKDPALREKHA